MNNTAKLSEKYAKVVPGEQTQLLGLKDIAAEPSFSQHYVFEEHPLGMPVASYRDEAGKLVVVQKDGLCHALAAGSTGCGKSMRYLTSCLFSLRGNSSVIVADVKGELYRVTASYLKEVYGDDCVRYMDFIHPERSEILFNPIAELARKYLEAEVSPDRELIRNEVLADLKKLFDKLFPIRSTKDMSWDEGARGFIYGITIGLFEDMLLTKEEEKKTKRRRVKPEQINFETISEIYYRFDYNTHSFNDNGFFGSREKNSLTHRYVRGIMNDAPHTRACYLQLVESYLNGYSYPDVRTLTISDNFDVSSLGDKPQVVFLTYDISDLRMQEFVNQYVLKALDTLKKKAIDGGAPLTVPVQFLLDEFPTLRADPIYPTIFSVGRGLNLFITAIVQDYTQLETAYSGGVAQQIRNNCNLTFFLGTNDVNTAKAVKEQIGKHTIPDPAAYLAGKVKFIETFVVSEDELMHRIHDGDTYITINNHQPIKSKFELYYDCPEYTAYPLTGTACTSAIDFKDPAFHYDASWLSDNIRGWME